VTEIFDSESPETFGIDTELLDDNDEGQNLYKQHILQAVKDGGSLSIDYCECACSGSFDYEHALIKFPSHIDDLITLWTTTD
jgi:hypothetical protein